jgi:hypothetical protein
MAGMGREAEGQGRGGSCLAASGHPARIADLSAGAYGSGLAQMYRWLLIASVFVRGHPSGAQPTMWTPSPCDTGGGRGERRNVGTMDSAAG